MGSLKTLCDQTDCEGNQCNGFMCEGERVIEAEKENITDNFLTCKKCGYEQMTMRRIKFSSVMDSCKF